jgi:hypothetical protein
MTPFLNYCSTAKIKIVRYYQSSFVLRELCEKESHSNIAIYSKILIIDGSIERQPFLLFFKSW